MNLQSLKFSSNIFVINKLFNVKVELCVCVFGAYPFIPLTLTVNMTRNNPAAGTVYHVTLTCKRKQTGVNTGIHSCIFVVFFSSKDSLLQSFVAYHFKKIENAWTIV